MPSATPPAGAPRPRTRTIAQLALAGVALLSCIEAVQVYVGMHNVGNTISFADAIRSTLPSWIILAVLLVPTALLLRRVPLERRHLGVAVPVHLVAAAVFTVVHLAGTALAAELLFSPIGYGRRFAELATMYFTLDVLTYTAVIGVFQLMRLHQREVARERAAVELGATLSHARFLALRNQLDPHFIFNALNAINTLALRGERDELMQTVTSLSSLLRQSLQPDAPQLVPLAVELQYVSQYLALQTMRFRNRLRVETLVTSDAGTALVPALSVHSLVEEAVSRRMRGSARCDIRLQGACVGDHVHVELVLDGPGTAGELDGPVRALGVRLDRLYGDRYDLDTQSAPDGRTIIRLRIPGQAPVAAH